MEELLKDPKIVEYGEILAFLAEDLIVHKPIDPIDHLLRTTLTFPFEVWNAGGSNTGVTPPASPALGSSMATAAEGEHSGDASRGSFDRRTSKQEQKFLSSGQASMRPCCSYSLQPAFSDRLSAGSTITSILSSFLSSPSCNLMVIVGGSDTAEFGARSRQLDSSSPAVGMDASMSILSQSSSLGTFTGSASPTSFQSVQCDCSGSGKSRLISWLLFPGQYLHKRKVLHVTSTNVSELVKTLDEEAALHSVKDTWDNQLELSISEAELSRATPNAKGLDPHHLKKHSPPNDGTHDVRHNAKLSPMGDTTGGGGEGVQPMYETLTLVDNVEPPHQLLHSLLRRNYFKNGRQTRGLHKTIVFTRPDVFFRFPLPCPMYRMSRIPFGAKWSDFGAEPEAGRPTIGLPSFSTMFNNGGDASTFQSVFNREGGKKKRERSIRFSTAADNVSPPVRSPTVGAVLSRAPPKCYKERSSGCLSDLGCRRVLAELEERYAQTVQMANAELLATRAPADGQFTQVVPMSLSDSGTFAKLKLSRATAERTIAHFLVHQQIIPLFDISQFPRLTQEMVMVPRCNLYCHKYFNKIRHDLTRSIVSRLIIGNFLCLVLTAQQSLVPFTLPATATDLLQLYLNTFCNALQEEPDTEPTSLGHPPVGIDIRTDIQIASPSSPPIAKDTTMPEMGETATPPKSHLMLDGSESLGIPSNLATAPPSQQNSMHAWHRTPNSSFNASTNASEEAETLPLRRKEVSFLAEPEDGLVKRNRLSFTHKEGTHLAHLLCETLMYLDLGDVVVERIVEVCSTIPPLVAHALLDLRGTSIDSDLFQTLRRGTSRAHLRRASLASSFGTSPMDPDLHSQESQPTGLEAESSSGVHLRGPDRGALVLSSDVTEVGERGYLSRSTAEAGAQPFRENASSHGLTQRPVLHSYLCTLCNHGVRAVIVVERRRVFAQGTFGISEEEGIDVLDSTEPTDGHKVLWRVDFAVDIVVADLHSPVGRTGLSHQPEGSCGAGEILALMLSDGNLHLLCLERIPLGAHVRVSDPLRQDSQRFSFPPATEIFKDESRERTPDTEAAKNATPPTIALHSTSQPFGTATPLHTDLRGTLSGGSLRAGARRSLSNVSVEIVQLNAAAALDSSGSPPTATERLTSGESTLAVGEMPMDSFVECIPSSITAIDDPFICAVSGSFAACVGEDTDLIVVIQHRFSEGIDDCGMCPPMVPDMCYDDSPATPLRVKTGTDDDSGGSPGMERQPPVVLQTDDNVNSVAIVSDTYLVAGLVNGTIQVFDIRTGLERESFTFHETKINVIRSMTRPAPPTLASPSSSGSPSSSLTPSKGLRMPVPPAASPTTVAPVLHDLFIAGAEDSTFSVFAIDDGSLIRNTRVHSTPVIDIVAKCAHTHGVIVTIEMNGTICVQTIDCNNLHQHTRVVWTLTMPMLKGVHLCEDASWLLCSRSNHSPLALPVSEWTRQGTGQFHTKPISTLHISQNERYLLSGGEDGVIFVWDLRNSVSFVTSFRQHNPNSTITSIATNADATEVLSSDDQKFICRWDLKTGEMLKIVDRGTGGIAHFLPFDFTLVMTEKGLKIFDPSGKMVLGNPAVVGSGAYDVFFADEALYNECFPLPPIRPPSGVRSTSTSGDYGSDVDDDERNSPRRRAVSPAVEVLSGNAAAIANRLFIGVAQENSDSSDYWVGIYRAGRLGQGPEFKLQDGELEDEFGDEEEVQHEDTIKAFKFLQPRVMMSPDADNDPFYAPQLFLAAAGGQDLSVILWNWRKQEPLQVLQHSHFVTSLDFFYPIPYIDSVENDSSPDGSGTTTPRQQKEDPESHNMDACLKGYESEMTKEHKKFLSTYDPSCANANGVLCTLVTSQFKEDSHRNTTLRVFQIRAKNAQRNRRIPRMTAKGFNYNMLDIVEEVALSSPAAASSCHTISVRPSDGLVCTGHDGPSEIIFWKWLPSSHKALHEFTCGDEFFKKVNSPQNALAKAASLGSLMSPLLGGRNSSYHLLGVGVDRPNTDSVLAATGEGDQEFSPSASVKLATQESWMGRRESTKSNIEAAPSVIIDSAESIRNTPGLPTDSFAASRSTLERSGNTSPPGTTATNTIVDSMEDDARLREYKMSLRPLRRIVSRI